MKKNKIKELVRNNNVIFLAIQETKLETITPALCYNLWGSEDYDWSFRPSIGNSGGILSIWQIFCSNTLFTFGGEGFVGVCLEWGVVRHRCIVINVYSKCDLEEKKKLWDSLIEVRSALGDGAWCILGDFNAVGRRDERRGVNAEASASQVTEMGLYNNFVRDVEFADLNVLGRRFTWFHPNGRAMSRIVRVLISEERSNLWGGSSLWVLLRDVSDHCPLVLKVGGWDWGPRPFLFNNFWLEHKKFKEVVEECWRSHSLSGWMGFVLREKLKHLKGRLRDWHKVEYGEMDGRVERLVDDIRSLDEKGEMFILDALEMQNSKDLFTNLWRLLRARDASLIQRAKNKWLKDGDVNSNFFHKCVKIRAHRNSIKALKVNDRWVQSPQEVRCVVVDFFSSHVASKEWDRPKLDGVPFPRLSVSENEVLVAPFSVHEIEVAVKESDGNKSPGPDDFSNAFLKEFWYLIKGQVRVMFDQLHGNGVVPKSLLSYYVTLIPKVSSLLALKDFRPISLLGCLYKLLAKVLASRLAKVMDSIISPSQSAFLKGRNLVDGVLEVNELVDFAKKSNRQTLILKVNFEKAYDLVDWGFLVYMLRRMGFDEKWVGWMKACVCGGSMSVLVNRSPTEEINIHKGLKQGDLLAPFLFLIVAEGFGGLMRNAINLHLFEGFRFREDGLVISHLQYADDTLCIGKPSVENLWTLKALLRRFEMVSGLKVNFFKSCLIGVNVPSEFMDIASSFLNCTRGSLPFKYLGLPVRENPKRQTIWEPLLEQLSKKLNSWGNRFISLGGRVVPLNSVLNSIPIFYLSFMKLPVLVWKKIVRIQREFL